jgi:hypothetical protein
VAAREQTVKYNCYVTVALLQQAENRLFVSEPHFLNLLQLACKPLSWWSSVAACTTGATHSAHHLLHHKWVHSTETSETTHASKSAQTSKSSEGVWLGSC